MPARTKKATQADDAEMQDVPPPAQAASVEDAAMDEEAPENGEGEEEEEEEEEIEAQRVKIVSQSRRISLYFCNALTCPISYPDRRIPRLRLSSQTRDTPLAMR